MSTSSSFQGRVAAAVAVALICVFALAQAAGADPPPACHEFSDGIEFDDGSVVALGSECLVKFRPDGTIDQEFGNEGIARVPAISDTSQGDLIRTPSGFVVMRPYALFAFTSAGQTDTTFGDQGKLEPTDSLPFTGIFDATADPAGNIYFTGIVKNGVYGRQSVVKLKADGSLDPAFGDAGIYRETEGSEFEFSFYRLELDGQGRLLVAGEGHGYPQPIHAGVIRLTTDGDLDETFGVAGHAESLPIPNPGPCAGGCQIEIDRIGFAPGGGFALMGWVRFLELKTGYVATFWAKFGSDGAPQAVSNGHFPSSASAQALLPNGDLALASGVGQRIHPDGTDAFPPGRDFDGRKLAEGGFYSRSLSFNPSTGNLLNTGSLNAKDDCFNFVCPARARAAAMKIDAGTGEPVPGFGVNGTVMASRNDCPVGRLPSVEGRGPWSRCRLARPVTSVKSKLGHGRSDRPSLWVRAKLDFPPIVPLFLEQELRILLPPRLPLRRGWKGRLSVERSSASPGTFRSRVRGRTIVVRYEQTPVPLVPYDPYDEGEPPPPNGSVEAVVKLDRGSIKPFPRKVRGGRMTPLASGRVMANTLESIPWWGVSKWSRALAGFKVPKRDR